MRQRTNMNGLAYHAKPSGKGCQSAHDKCEQSIKRLEKLLNEGYKLSDVKKQSENPKAVITIVFGKETKVDIQVFKARYEPLGFKVVAEIF